MLNKNSSEHPIRKHKIPRRPKMRQRSDYPTFSDKEMARRHEAIENLMAQEGVVALLVYSTGRYASDIYWLSDWLSSREATVFFSNVNDSFVLIQLIYHFL